MAFRVDVKRVFESPILQIDDVRWCVAEPGLLPECLSPAADITFLRSGFFAKTRGRRELACDPNTVIFINPGETFGTRHAFAVPCACTSLYFDADVVREVIAHQGGGTQYGPDGLFAFEQCPASTDVVVAHHRLLSLARTLGSASPLAVEESAVNLAARAIGAACEFNGHRRPRRRTTTLRAHADTVQSVKEFLAANLGERLTLSRIAAHVHCAPGHLCHVFKQLTGVSIHRYSIRLRLAAALDWLPETTDLSALAMRLGFASHSHFSSTFRREFGVSPSRLRRSLRVAPTRQKRTKLIV